MNSIRYLIIVLSIIMCFEERLGFHYQSRLKRNSTEENSFNFFTMSFSLFMLIFHILIFLGLIKACVGLCCKQISQRGLHLLINQSSDNKTPRYLFSRNTEFCLNVIFFLALPFILLTRIFYINPCDCDPDDGPSSPTSRMPGGAETIHAKSKRKYNSPSILLYHKKKKSNLKQQENDCNIKDQPSKIQNEEYDPLLLK